MKTSPWLQMTPRERARSRLSLSELAMTDHAGHMTENFETATTMLGIACDLLARLTGKTRAEVLDALAQAAKLIPMPEYRWDGE